MNDLAEMAESCCVGLRGLPAPMVTAEAVAMLRALVLAHRHGHHVAASSIAPTDDGGFSIVFDAAPWSSVVEVIGSGAVRAEEFYDGQSQFIGHFGVQCMAADSDMTTICNTILEMFATGDGGGIYEQG